MQIGDREFDATAEPLTDPGRIADFIELRLRRHPIMIRLIWQDRVVRNAKNMHHRLDFMSEEHHNVRDFVVLEIPRRGTAISPEDIAREVNLSLQRTEEILDELERGMTLLFRNSAGEVAWAYPVTAETTPHRIHFSSGEHIYAA